MINNELCYIQISLSFLLWIYEFPIIHLDLGNKQTKLNDNYSNHFVSMQFFNQMALF